ncbi:hypothetical protein [Streptomyces sp. NPDC055107]
MAMKPCNSSDANQKWVRKSSNAQGYGGVYGVDGRCIATGLTLLPARLCSRVEQAPPQQWKQFPDGKVRNTTSSRIWVITGSRDFAGFGTAQGGPGTVFNLKPTT